jgi:hydrogenase maturation protease
MAMSGEDFAPVLVIGYGNVLRGDDGLGVRVAEAVAAWRRPGVEVHAVHQLTPELAEAVAGARLVVFVDARPAAGCTDVRVQRLMPAGAGVGLGHSSDPTWLLGLAEALYGSCPQASLVTVPGSCFRAGVQLSPTAAGALKDAVGVVAGFLEPTPHQIDSVVDPDHAASPARLGSGGHR